MSIPIHFSVPTVFKTVSQAVVITLPLISPKVSNLDSLVQNQVSCQLDEGRIMKPICQRTLSFEVPIGTDPITHVYKTRIFPVKLRDQYKIKNPRFDVSGLIFLFYVC